MTTKRKGQQWILDALTGTGGWDILHPGIRGFFEELGYFHGDVDRVFEKVKCARMYSKAWATTAQEVERKARFAESQGWKTAARDFYARAGILYGRTRYTYFSDDPRKMNFNKKTNECFDKVISYGSLPIERVELDFEGKKIYGLLYLNGSSNKNPVIILGSGTDMFKEDWHRAAERYYLPRGFVVLSFDGPGQGESLVHGCKVTWDNYDRAVEKFIDYLCERPEVDNEKISYFGVSTGSYWGFSAALHDKRIRALATGMGNIGRHWEGEYELAQPNFKINFMYMSGYQDEDKFDKEIAAPMVLGDRAKAMTCPSLIVHGEFDELTPLEHVIETYEKVGGPKEMWVMEDEFHPIGPIATDWLSCVGDWLLQMLNGEYDENMDRRLFWRKTGVIDEGSVEPPWWSVRP